MEHPLAACGALLNGSVGLADGLAPTGANLNEAQV